MCVSVIIHFVMPQITAIEPQKRKKGRFNIFVDGKFAFGLDEKILADFNFKIGQNLTQNKIEEIITAAELGKIIDKVYNFLSFRPRSAKEIEQYLKRKKFGEEEKKIVLKKLEKSGFINDVEFAKFFVESRVKFRPKGTRLITAELRQKGVDREIIEKVLAQIGISEVELAQKSISKKLDNFLKLPQLKARNKIAQFLARRGFSWETIKIIIDSKMKLE